MTGKQLISEKSQAANSNAREPSSEAPFGLSASAFRDNFDEEAFFFPSDQHLRAIEFMGHLLWTRARLGVVTAEHGCGKSLLISRLLRDLDDRFIAASIARESVTAREFTLEILRQFGISLEDNDKTDRRRLLESFLKHQAAKGRVCLLVVENAQNMHPSVLEELRFLASIEADGSRVLKVLMLGQPALTHVLESPRMAEMLALSVPRFSLGPLSEDQTAAYVAHRLRAAGAANPDALMPYTLMPAIYGATRGVPARINRLCERALTHAAAESAPLVTTSALESAMAELGMQFDVQASLVEAGEQPWVAPTLDIEAKLAIAIQGAPEIEVTLKQERVLVGRGEEADVRIDSVFVSRYHALIVRDGGRDLLLDLGSTNGLLVNSRRILRRALRHRDLIQIGPAKVTYLNPAADPATQFDPGETVCFARAGFPVAAGEEDQTAVLAFGRFDNPSRR
jgi:general secretion pathway protein A